MKGGVGNLLGFITLCTLAIGIIMPFDFRFQTQTQLLPAGTVKIEQHFTMVKQQVALAP